HRCVQRAHAPGRAPCVGHQRPLGHPALAAGPPHQALAATRAPRAALPCRGPLHRELAPGRDEPGREGVRREPGRRPRRPAPVPVRRRRGGAGRRDRGEPVRDGRLRAVHPRGAPAAGRRAAGPHGADAAIAAHDLRLAGGRAARLGRRDPGHGRRPCFAPSTARARPRGARPRVSGPLVPYELIRRKRDGGELSADELRALLDGYADGRLGDEQMAAFLMAVFFRGLTPAELAVFVQAILESGTVLDLSGIPGPKVDKHSTGGVGDKVSLVLAPLVASLGVVVPMMSGRSLGHTGGTLDKLETIPGFRTDLTIAEMRAQLERIGCVLIGQTDEIAPLDRRLYALRDATATVESIPLIASSIMGKKLAEGAEALVLDVKLGSGAFLPDEARALELARTMVEIGRVRGRQVTAIT